MILVAKCAKTPPVPVNHFINHLETWHTYNSGATLNFPQNTLPRISPWFRAINTQSDLGRTP